MMNEMSLVLGFFDDLMGNKVDLIFFISILGIILLLIIVLIASRIVTARKDKKYEKGLDAKSNTEEVAEKESVIEETEEAPVTEEVVEETEEAPVTEEVVEETEDAPVTEEVVEETEDAPVTEEVVEETEEAPVTEEVVEETEETPVTEEVVEETEETPVTEEVVEETEETPITEEVVEETEETPITEEVVEEPKETVTATKAAPKKKPAAKTAAKKTVEAKVVETKVTEEEPVKKGRSYNGKYEVFKLGEEGWAYTLKASNGEVLVNSETYTSRDGVLKAIASVQRNIETGTVRIDADKNDQYQFKLISKNYRVLAVSANYPTEKGAQRASESFKKFAAKADITEIELKDTKKVGTSTIEITDHEDKLGGKYTIEKDPNGKFSWDLKANNGQILCQQNGYTTKAGCMKSIESFKNNVATGSFKCIKDKNNCYCFKLYSPSGRICAVGESYQTKTSAESAAGSVDGFYKNAEIVDLTSDVE